jgi:hypothetical protein
MRRLFDDPEQPAALRDDLLRSRDAGRDYPTADKLDALRAALSDSARQPLGEGAPLGRHLAWRALHPGWKLAALLALGGAGGFIALRSLSPLPALPPEPMPAQPPSAEPAAQDTAPAPTAVAQPSTADDSMPAPTAVRPPSAADGSAPAAVAQPSAAGDNALAPSSRREIAQLVRIRALLEQDPAAAYRLAQRSEREFPSGLLREERQALAIVALAKTGARETARAKASEFFARFPQSPMRDVIEAELDRARP